jgi:hypothetical protein
MSKLFDATPKGLLEIRPSDWPAFVGVQARTVEILDADVSTVTAATDKVLLVRADQGDRIQHFDFQSGPDASVPRRTHGYNAMLEERHGLPVDSGDKSGSDHFFLSSAGSRRIARCPWSLPQACSLSKEPKPSWCANGNSALAEV